MVRSILLYLPLVMLNVNCGIVLTKDGSSGDVDRSTRFTITNKTSDMDVQVVLGSSSITLEKEECVQSSFGDLAQIQVSIKPSVIQPSWLEQCKKNNKCRFDEGAWFTFCESGQCRQGYDQHYELQGSATERQKWETTSRDPSQNCSSFN